MLIMQAGLAQYKNLHPSNKPRQGVALLPKFSIKPSNKHEILQRPVAEFKKMHQAGAELD